MYRFNLITIGIVLAVSSSALGQYTGPEFPPPGGVSYSGSGDAGRAGGRTWNYWNLDPTQYGSLFWGPTGDITSTFSSVYSSGSLMTFGGLVNPNEAIWLGTSVLASPTEPWYSVNTEFILTLSQPLSPALGIGSNSEWAQITGTSFSANLQFLAQSPFTGGWVGLDDLFNSVNTYYLDSASYSFTGAFWNTQVPPPPPPPPPVPEPAPSLAIGLGLAGLLIRRKRA